MGMVMGNDFYVYCYFRPDGSPCYIGKGQGRRWKQHLKHSSNPRLKNIIAKAGGEIPHVKLCTGLTPGQASEYEIAWIKTIGRGHTGPLVNMTDGGDGTIGFVPSIEQRAKQRARITGTKHSLEARANMSAVRLGKKRSPATIAKMKAAMIGVKKSEKHRIAMRVKHKPFSQEARAKISASRIGRKHSQETKDKMSAAHLGRKKSPEAVAKSSAARRKIDRDKLRAMKAQGLGVDEISTALGIHWRSVYRILNPPIGRD